MLCSDQTHYFFKLLVRLSFKTFRFLSLLHSSVSLSLSLSFPLFPSLSVFLSLPPLSSLSPVSPSSQFSLPRLSLPSVLSPPSLPPLSSVSITLLWFLCSLLWPTYQTQTHGTLPYGGSVCSEPAMNFSSPCPAIFQSHPSPPLPTLLIISCYFSLCLALLFRCVLSLRSVYSQNHTIFSGSTLRCLIIY